MPNIDLLNSINQKYDGTTSELTATNAQAAIDEVVAALQNLPIAFPGNWVFDSVTTEGDPGTGQFRMNTGAYATTTAFYFDEETANGILIPEYLFPNLRAGQRFLCVEGDIGGQRIGFYEITGPAVDNTTYWTVPVTFVDEGTGGFFRNGRQVAFNFLGVGDPNGVSGPASAVDQNIAVFDGTTGKVIDDGGIAKADIVELAADNQFAGLTEKASPIGADQVLVEDSAAAGAKVRVPFSSFVSAGGGDVSGPASATNNSLAAFDGTTGKLIKDATYSLPPGGTTGQALVKIDGTDYNWQWGTVAGGGGDVTGPAGGTFQGMLTIYADTTGKVIEDSPLALVDNIGTFSTLLNWTDPNTNRSAVFAINNTSPGSVFGDGGFIVNNIHGASTNYVGFSAEAATNEVFGRFEAITTDQNITRFTIQASGGATDNIIELATGGVERLRVEDTGIVASLPVTLPGAPTLDNHSSTKAYVDANIMPEAPDDQSRSYFREGTTPDWTRTLKGYGEVAQTTAVSSGGETIAVDDGNFIISNLSGAYTLTALNASLTNMSATWILQHNGQTVSFPASFKFTGDTPPVSVTGNTWILGLFTFNSGTTWVVTYVEDYTL